MSSVVLRLEDVRSPRREIIDQVQIFGSGMIHVAIVRGEHAPDAPRFADERGGLNGTDAGIEHDFKNAGPGEEGAVGDVRNDDAPPPFQGSSTDGFASMNGAEKFQERFVKTTVHMDMQLSRFVITKLDVAHVGTGTFDDGIEDSGKERRSELGTKGPVLGQCFDLGVKGFTHEHGFFERLTSLKPHGAGAVDHQSGLLDTLVSILNGRAFGSLRHGFFRSKGFASRLRQPGQGVQRVGEAAEYGIAQKRAGGV